MPNPLSGRQPALQRERLGRQQALWWVLLIFASAVLLLGAFSGQNTVMWTSAALVMVSVLRLRCGVLVNAAVIPGVIFVPVAIIGYARNDTESPRAGSSFFTSLPDAISASTLQLACGSSIIIALGALLTLPTSTTAGSLRGLIRVSIHNDWLGKLLAFSWVPVLLSLLATGVGPLLDRANYLIGSSGGLASVSSTFTLASLAIFGYIAAASVGRKRFFAIAGATLLLLIFFASGSRRMAFWPTVFVAGMALQRRSKRTSAALVFALVISVWLLRVPLYLRSLDSHGLIPYAKHLGDALFSNPSGNPALNNILSSFPIIGTTAFIQPSIPFHYVLTELNPLPGRLVGWYDISPNLRLNAATPYSGLGELGNHGVVSSWMVLFPTGMYLGYIERRIRAFSVAGIQFLAVLYLGLVGLFSVGLLQYDLRSSFRGLYYLAALDVAVRFVPALRTRRPLADPADKSLDAARAVSGSTR